MPLVKLETHVHTRTNLSKPGSCYGPLGRAASCWAKPVAMKLGPSAARLPRVPVRCARTRAANAFSVVRCGFSKSRKKQPLRSLRMRSSTGRRRSSRSGCGSRCAEPGFRASRRRPPWSGSRHPSQSAWTAAKPIIPWLHFLGAGPRSDPPHSRNYRPLLPLNKRDVRLENVNADRFRKSQTHSGQATARGPDHVCLPALMRQSLPTHAIVCSGLLSWCFARLFAVRVCRESRAACQATTTGGKLQDPLIGRSICCCDDANSSTFE